ncbi:anti-sigma factor [Kineosporia sp. A_224]|uniref:anti-sigma factor family protein n=1 Tax=Kineosporia sp. A_224 TaxID=1962180 RepID=UPI000B4A5910|nr:zf-HC2 domain-containing protein [Kineosporia sp. A_224]
MQESVAALLLGGLPPREAVRVEEHLLGCDECAATRRELAIVRTMLDTLDRADAGAPGDLVAAAALPDEAEIAAVTGVRQHRGRREIRLAVVAAAAAFLVGVLPAGLWIATHRDATVSVQLAGTVLAPDAWATVRFLPRAEGTIVDVEAGDLPTSGGRYAVTVSSPGGGVLARQEFTVSPDGWAQVVLATTEPVGNGGIVTVDRVDGPAPGTVLDCRCTA